MSFEQSLVGWFRMTDDVWERHANPWSVWTRFASFPLLALSAWSRTWIGNWPWVPFVLILLWIWINPRAFPRPASTDNWASRAVLGERVWLNRRIVPIPAHHAPVIWALYTMSAAGLVLCSYGLAFFRPCETVGGLALCMIGKCWFLDRMVWLFDEMRMTCKRYSDWLYD